jgi:hypothetical protein
MLSQFTIYCNNKIFENFQLSLLIFFFITKLFLTQIKAKLHVSLKVRIELKEEGV